MTAREPRMTPLFFHLMLSLSKGPKHGYAMMGEVSERTGGRIEVGPSSLYYALGRLEEAGWMAEAEGPVTEEGSPHEERRRYYRLTALGRRRLEEEAETLADVLAHARAQGVIG